MFNPWSWADYPEKSLTRTSEEKAIRQVGRLTLTETQVIILCENGYKEKFRLNEITAIKVQKKSGAKYPVLGFAFGIILILFFGGIGYYFIPHLIDTRNPVVVGQAGKMAGLLLIAILGFTVVGFYMLYLTIMSGPWWWLGLTASGQTYQLPIAKTKDTKEQEILDALSERHLPR